MMPAPARARGSTARTSRREPIQSAGMPASPTLPTAELDAASGLLRLAGDWTLAQAATIQRALKQAGGDARGIDASGVDAIDSLGVLQL